MAFSKKLSSRYSPKQQPQNDRLVAKFIWPFTELNRKRSSETANQNSDRTSEASSSHKHRRLTGVTGEFLIIAKTALFAYIELFYNRQRAHATLDYQSPYQYERRGACA